MEGHGGLPNLPILPEKELHRGVVHNDQTLWMEVSMVPIQQGFIILERKNIMPCSGNCLMLHNTFSLQNLGESLDGIQVGLLAAKQATIKAKGESNETRDKMEANEAELIVAKECLLTMQGKCDVARD
ncbi:hypothetical protein R1flu_025577 [Riccia fluitans]|uniref:Uncharacterized protein n=1 Tax=Riccia fluitans TaxID=41844 RepID=A0ABD1XYI3_9MARC